MGVVRVEGGGCSAAYPNNSFPLDKLVMFQLFDVGVS